MGIRFNQLEAKKLINAIEAHLDSICEISKQISDLMCNFNEWDDENRKIMEVALQELYENIADIADNESQFIDSYKSKIADLET